MQRGPISQFMEKHYRHFNAAAMMDAAKAYEVHLAEGGKMMVTLRTVCNEGTRLIAASKGRVTLTIIFPAGCRPLSAITFTLGKVTSGKSEDCRRV